MNSFRFLILLSVTIGLFSWNEVEVDEPFNLDKTAVIDTIYNPSYMNPFVKGDERPYMRICRQKERLLALQFDLDTRHIDSLFYDIDRLDSLVAAFDSSKNSEIINHCAVYLDIIAVNARSIDVKYSAENRDYQFKAHTSKSLGTSMFRMYHGFFRLTYAKNKISIVSIAEEFEWERKVCDYIILSR